MTATLTPSGCLATKLTQAMDYVAQSATWQKLACVDGATDEERIEQAKKRIWLGRFNSEWFLQKPQLQDDSLQDKFPICVIDSRNHHLKSDGSQMKPGGDLYVWLGVDIPQNADDFVISRHPHNADLYVANSIGKVIEDVGTLAAESNAFPSITQFEEVENPEEQWNTESGRYCWYGYEFTWGWS